VIEKKEKDLIEEMIEKKIPQIASSKLSMTMHLFHHN
jgi:hypothetical protein